MSYSLMIVNGDLSFNGASMDTISGGNKLVQDLACCILEPMGTDDMHPTFGSTIGGGISPDGTYTPGIVGTPNDATAAIYAQSEVSRIASQYQAAQQVRFQADVATYGKGTITADEALLSFANISAVGDQVTLVIQAQLQTGLNSVNVSLSVPSS